MGKINENSVLQSTTLFSLLNLMIKVNPNDLPGFLKDRAEQIAKENGWNKLANYYMLPSYGSKVLKESNDVAIILHNNNVSLFALSREYVLRNFGEELANKVYPQYEKENSYGTTRASDKRVEIMTEYVLSEIERQGYVLESDLTLEHQSKSTWKRNMTIIMNENGLVRVSANKELKAKYNIDVPERSYPKIIIKDE